MQSRQHGSPQVQVSTQYISVARSGHYTPTLRNPDYKPGVFNLLVFADIAIAWVKRTTTWSPALKFPKFGVRSSNSTNSRVIFLMSYMYSVNAFYV
jgi:hypothetical protein